MEITHEQKAPADGDLEQPPPLYDSQIKAVTQELLKYGVLEMSTKPNYYQLCLRQQQNINAIRSEERRVGKECSEPGRTLMESGL